MDPFTRMISIGLISIAGGLFLNYIIKSNNAELLKNLKEEHVVIHLSKAYIWVGCLGILFTLACIFLTAYFQHDVWVELGFGFFSMLGIVIVAVTLIWKIHIFRHEDYFIYRTSFGRTHKIRYDECEYYKYGKNALVFKFQGKKFFVDNTAANFELLPAMLRQHKVKELIEKNVK